MSNIIRDVKRIFTGGSSSGGGGGGSVNSVSGTANRITSTGGANPIINISATFEALLFKITATEGLTAHAGGGQGSALALTTIYNFIDTVATTNDSVKALPAIKNAFQYIQNNGINDLKIYPTSGDNFSGLSANAALIISSGNQLTIVCATTGTWRYF